MLLNVDFDDDGPLPAETQSTLERALTVLDQAYEWGHNGSRPC
jgi:hypothetical protein